MSKQRKLTDSKKFSVPEKAIDGRTARGKLSQALKPKTKDLGSSLEVSIEQAVQEQERDKMQQQTRHTKALKSCLGQDGNVRTDCMSNLVKLMEHTSNPKEKIPILHVLEKSAKDPDSSRWTRFMEIKGMSLLRQWLTKASHASGGMGEGESDKIVCGCLNVLRRLPLSLERARAEGLLQACNEVGSGRAIYVRRLANELIQSWQAADASANGTNGQDSEDSDLESVDDDDEIVSTQVEDCVLPDNPSVDPLSAQQRLEEAETQKTLQGLKELGQLLGAPDKKETQSEVTERHRDDPDDSEMQQESHSVRQEIPAGVTIVPFSHVSATDSQVSDSRPEENSTAVDDDVSTEDESSDDDDPLVTPMELPNMLREHRWDGYSPDPLNCAALAPKT